MKFWKYTYLTLVLILATLLIAVYSLPDDNFHLISCNVGQGDATLMIYKNIQVLVDGGPDNKVMDCLGKHIPFYDKELELVVLTHPDNDHYFGLIEVFKRYKVDNYLYNNVNTSSQGYRVLQKEVGGSGAKLVEPMVGQVLRLGKIQLDILSPDSRILGGGTKSGEVVEVKEGDTNDLSIIALVSFEKFKALLTGDMSPRVSDDLATDNKIGLVNYIKIPHHGSRNGLTLNLLKATMPKLAVISVGKNNYGHPSSEIINILKENGISFLRTDEVGDVRIETDGKTWKVNDF